MIIRMSLVSLLPALLIGVAAAQTPSGPTVDGHQLQPSQQRVDVKEDNNRRERDRRNQAVLDRLLLRNSTSIVTAET